MERRQKWRVDDEMRDGKIMKIMRCEIGDEKIGR
jgi:hypothetical protein